MTFTVGPAIVFVLVLLILSAFFSGTETGVTAASRARLTELERRGSWRAAIILELTKRRERMIGAMLLGNTVVSILGSAVATAALVKIFGDLGAVIASVVMTVLILIFGEVMPKTYAVTNPEKVAITMAPLLKVVVALFGPFIMAVEYVVQGLFRLFGADLANADSALSAHDEIRGAIDLHHKEGAVVAHDRNMLGGILDLQDLEVADIMVHRTKMNMVDAASPMADIIDTLLKTGNTRLPVWKESPDNIVGVLHAKNLFAALQKTGGDVTKIVLDDILSPAWFVPDTRPLTDQLNAFLRRKTHFAIVVDEYGEVQGLITLEDIIEEIVGDIKDEHDDVAKSVRKQADGSYVVDGMVPLRDLKRAFGWQLPDDEATTLAGLVIHEARQIPDPGQVFNFHGFRFEIVRKRRQQIVAIKVTPARSEAGE